MKSSPKNINIVAFATKKQKQNRTNIKRGGKREKRKLKYIFLRQKDGGARKRDGGAFSGPAEEKERI